MVRKTIKVKNTLDARQNAFLVQCAGQFKSEIHLEEDEKFINAKSMMGTLSLAIEEGDTITIAADGADENEAVEEICKILVG